MKKIVICVVALVVGMLLTGCQREVTVVPAPQQQQQPNIIVNPQQPNVIVVPGRPQCPPPHPRPGIHIHTPGVDINVRPGYRWCNRCGVWVANGHHHNCR